MLASRPTGYRLVVLTSSGSRQDDNVTASSADVKGPNLVVMQNLKLLVFLPQICFVFATAQVALGTSRSTKAQAPAVEKVVHVSAPGANDSRYMYIPFDVPSHAVKIHVSYQYDRANGANTIDIGLFDARSSGSDTDPRGFRGWSGGRRSDFFVSRDEATPGYMRGNLPAGKWRVILGLYRIAPAGVDVSLKVEIETKDKPSGLNVGSRPSS